MADVPGVIVGTTGPIRGLAGLAYLVAVAAVRTDKGTKEATSARVKALCLWAILTGNGFRAVQLYAAFCGYYLASGHDLTGIVFGTCVHTQGGAVNVFGVTGEEQKQYHGATIAWKGWEMCRPAGEGSPVQGPS